MATNVHFEQRFPAGPEAVWEMLTDPAYVTFKGMRSGSLEVEPEVVEEEHRTVIISRRRMPAQLPSFMVRLVGEVLVVHETQTWEPAGPDGGRRGRFIIDFGGQPMAFNGTLALRAGPPGTVVTTDGSLKANVPVVGRKAESVAAEWVQRYLAKEEAVAAEWLAGRRS